MARPSTKSFEERMFKGNRVAAALAALQISQDKFLREYDEANIPRSKPSEKLAETQARLEAAEAEIARLSRLKNGEASEEREAA